DTTLAIQRPTAARAEGLHETALDQSGIARRLCGAGLVVDPGGEKQRPAIGKAAIDQGFEMRFVAHPVASRDAGGVRDRDNVGDAAGGGNLLAGDLVEAVVPDDDG